VAEAVSIGAEIRSTRDEAGGRVLSLLGRLDSETTGAIWRRAMSLTAGEQAGALVVDASGLEYCDGAGVSLLVALRQRQQEAGGSFTLRGLRDEFRQLLEMAEPSEGEGAQEAPPHHDSFIEALGRATLQILADIRVWGGRPFRSSRTFGCWSCSWAS
jgi:phospholipid/cholesterol/gamma-HCH transport system permease protein